MAGKINVYQLGTGGVNLSKGPMQMGDNEVLSAQNAELVQDVEKGGEGSLSKRGGYLPVNAAVLANPVVEMAEIRFIDEDDVEGPSSVTELEPDTEETLAASAELQGEEVGEDAADVIRTGVDDVRYVLFLFTDEDPALTVTMTPVPTDPAIDTGHSIVVRFYVSGSAPGEFDGGAIEVGLYVTGTGFVAKYAVPQGVWQQDTWVEYEVPIPEADVATWRGLGGYAAPELGIAITNNNPDSFLVGISKLTLKIPVVS